MFSKGRYVVNFALVETRVGKGVLSVLVVVLTFFLKKIFLGDVMASMKMGKDN